MSALLLMELGVRGAGLALKAYLSHRNAAAMSARGTVRVMCIGDSMTFGQYPATLEKLLAKNKNGLKFAVIDRSLPGTNSSDTLLSLKKNLDAYQPNIVLAMIGENDKAPGRILQNEKGEKESGLKDLRIYRIWHYTRELLLKNRHLYHTRASCGASTENDHASAFEKYQKRQTAQAELPQTQRQEIERLSALIRGGQDREAQASLLDYLRRYPPHAEAHTWLGQLYAKAGRRAEAESQFERALKLAPEDYHAMCGLAELWLQNNEKLSEAEALLKLATELSPDDYHAFYQLGRACSLQAKAACAIENLRRAADLRPDFSPAQLELASAYKETALYGDAARTIEGMLKTDPDNSMAYAQLCSIYSTYEPQKTAFLHTARQALKNIRARNTVGLRVCAEQSARLFHELPLATQLHEQALKIAPDDTDTLTSAAAFYKREYNDFKKSRALSEKALRLNPQARDTTGLAFLLDEKSHAAVAEDARYTPVTISNYRKIRQVLAERGITLVAMQYPTRRLQPLKDILNGSSGVYFVSNENMKALAEQHGYSKYFVDMYAGDFGHCTQEGNRLVAENAADTILNEVLKR